MIHVTRRGFIDLKKVRPTIGDYVKVCYADHAGCTNWDDSNPGISTAKGYVAKLGIREGIGYVVLSMDRDEDGRLQQPYCIIITNCIISVVKLVDE